MLFAFTPPDEDPTVTDVVGLTEAAAQAALENDGFTLGAVTTTADGATAENDGLVATQTPAAGEVLAPGEPVALVLFAFTPPATTVAVAAVSGVTAPVTGATPVTAVTDSAEYTGTVTWSTSPTTFAAGTAYTATITLTAKDGFTLTGVTEDFFTVAGATVIHDANSGVITAVFPATAADEVVVAVTPVTVSIPSQPGIAVVVPASLEVGKTATLTTTGGAATGTNNFLSNSPTICTVTSAGVVTAVAAGTCSVYAQRTAAGFTTVVSADVTFKIMSAAEVKAIADAAVKVAADKAAADAAAAAVKAAADKAEAEAKAAEAAAAVAAEAARVEAVRLAGLNTVTSIKTVKGKTSIALNLADKYYGYILELQLRTVVKGKVRFTTIEYFAVQRENGVVTVSTMTKIAKGQRMRIMSEGKAVRYFRR